MRPVLQLLTLAAIASLPVAASAQGMLSLQNRTDFNNNSQPAVYSAGVAVGYDRLNYKASQAADFDSLFLQGGVGATWREKSQTTPWSLGLDFATTHYFDAGSRMDDTDYSARVVFDIAHSFSERLKMTDNFYLTYEVEPNFGLGASTALRNGQYLYGYNSFAVSYAWSQRFSTTTSYTLDGIRYDDRAIGRSEDRFSHLFGQSFNYAISKTLKGVFEYRYRTTQYRYNNNDYSSHYLLAGLDKAWSERTNGSFRAGAEFYSGQKGNKTAPYFEAAVHHATSDKTIVSAFTSLGFDGSELGSYDSRYSARVGVNAQHQVSKRLSLNAGLNYAYSTFDGAGQVSDVSEHELSATAGIGYRLWDNISLDANYSFTLLNSDDNLREYDRNRVSLGINANF